MIMPNRTTPFVLPPTDYGGLYDVVNASSPILSRRYVGEPRFVALVLNITTSSGWACVTPEGMP